MRRAYLALALGGVLLSGAACDSDAGGTTTAAPAATTPSTIPTSPPPDYSANTKLVCGKVATIYSKNFSGFATAMGKMIAHKEAKQTAEAEKAEKAAAAHLKSIGASIAKETKAAEDPQLKTAGAASAAKLTRSAADTKFFDGVKTTKDLDRTIEARMTDWMSPVTGYCAA